MKKPHSRTPKNNLLKRFATNTSIVALIFTASIGLVLNPDSAYSCQPPAQPNAISGSTSACSGASHIYSVSAVTGATSYTWVLPYGWTGTSTKDSITVRAGIAGGTISVTANDSCGSSIAQTLVVTSMNIPAKPGAITGSISVCSGSSITYSVAAVNGATSYTWTIPSDWTGSSSVDSISVTTGTVSGMITVKANNTCGSSLIKTLTVAASDTLPDQPGSIAGNAAICSGSAQIYSVAPANNATSYIWTLPSGWSGHSTGRSIQVKAGTSGGTVSVQASGSCGLSTVTTLTVTVGTVPAITDTIAMSGGIAHVCPGDARGYSVTLVPGLTYNWTAPAGASITSGQGTDSINVSFTNSFVSSGILSVKASNTCGAGLARSLSISRNLPPAPGAITITQGNVKVCPGDICIYSVPSNSSYTFAWTAPAGTTILSGQGTHAVRILYTNGFTAAGIIKVSAVNACGAGSPASMNISRNILASLGSINGLVYACGNTAASYSVAGVTSGNATYTWSVPDTVAVIDSGQGSTKIYISWLLAGGPISVSASNACGSTPSRSIVVRAGNCSEIQLRESAINNPDLMTRVYPNPVSGNATVEFTNNAPGETYSVKLFDVTGREIMNRKGTAEKGLNLLGLDMNGYPKGMYLLYVKSGDNNEVIKLAVQ